jgi:uncharacterized RDD family membrane protein YckC
MVQSAAQAGIAWDRHAGFASRLCAFGIDLVLINLALLLVTAAVGLVLRYFDYGNLFFEIGEEPTTLGRVILTTVSLVTFLIVYFGYPVFFWVVIGQTPGKRLLGLRVVRSADGQLMGVGQATLRAAAYWVSAIPLFCGFLWILIDNRRMGWHDKIAKSYVFYYHPKGKI